MIIFQISLFTRLQSQSSICKHIPQISPKHVQNGIQNEFNVSPGSYPSNVQVHRLRSVAAFVQSATEPRLCSAAETAFDLLASANRWRPDTRAFHENNKSHQKNRCPKWQQHETNTTNNLQQLKRFNTLSFQLGVGWLKPYVAKGPTALVRPIGPVVFGLEIAFGSTTRAPAKRGRAWNIWRKSKWITTKGGHIWSYHIRLFFIIS